MTHGTAWKSCCIRWRLPPGYCKQSTTQFSTGSLTFWQSTSVCIDAEVTCSVLMLRPGSTVSDASCVQHWCWVEAFLAERCWAWLLCRCPSECLRPALARLTTGGSASCSSRSSEQGSTLLRLRLEWTFWTRMLDGPSGKLTQFPLGHCHWYSQHACIHGPIHMWMPRR